ncbi:hypothetical protein LTEGF4_17700 [Limnohabitans sp. TEGF004]|nr:hypothetical protein LTEGF4_17700 [Limnohabitans sp. TEGF004]
MAVTTHVGYQFYAFGRAHKSTPSAFMRQSIVIAHIGHSKLVAHITGPLLKDGLQFALKKRVIEITGNW